MAVTTLDFTIQAVNAQFRFLILANNATGFHRLCFCAIMATHTRCSALFDIPTAVGIVNDVMRSSCHIITPYEL